MSAWVLILALAWGSSSSLTHIPFATKEACEAASLDIATKWPPLSHGDTVIVSCFPTGLASALSEGPHKGP